MTTGDHQSDALSHLRQTEQVLRTNLEARGLEGLGRAHTEIALAHTLEAAAGLQTDRCRTPAEVLHEHDTFTHGLHATLQQTISLPRPRSRRA